MKLTDVRNVFKMLCENEQLDEAMTSEFTFGFELEGVCTAPEDTEDESFSLPGYHSGNSPRGGAKVLFNQLNSTLGFGEGKIERDGSLSPSSGKGGWTFEYASPVIKMNPQNIEKVYTFLKNLPELKVYTNDTCGFHTHLSFPDISRNDAAWITVCCSIDDGMYEELTSFTKDSGETIEFFGGYAKPDRLKDIKNNIKNNDMRQLKRELDDEKYTVLRLHPDHGTLEWRGPRNFMNEGKVEDIHRYILKLYRVAQKMASYTRKNTISSSDGVSFSKDQIARLGIKASDYNYKFNSDYEKKLLSKGENLTKAFVSGKVTISSLSLKQLDVLLSNNSYEIKRKVCSIFENSEAKDEILKLPAEKFKLLFDAYCRYRDDSLYICVKRLLMMGIDVSSKLSSSQREDVISDLIQGILKSSSRSNGIDETMEKMIEIYKPLDTEKFKERIKSVSNIELKTLVWLLNKQRDKLPEQTVETIWKALLKPDRIHYLSWIDEIPVNIQRKLVRANPFNIQYIKSPDEAIVNWVLKKEPEAKDYMLGGI